MALTLKNAGVTMTGANPPVPTATQSPQISFDDDPNFFCRVCWLLNYEQIPVRGLDYECDLRWGLEQTRWNGWFQKCGRCRLLFLAMEAFGQKASRSISANDTLRFMVLATSPFDSFCSWLEFYRLEGG
jgi:hypothetical protein